jgi:AcrR family transcriptional regulator
MVKESKQPPRPKTKGDKRARTRAQLIEAASKVINEKGFDRTTLEEVARRAGMTRGAIYNNFTDKEDLFMAVSETRWQPIAPPFKPGASLKEQMTILGKAVAAAAAKRRAIAVGALSFQLYALTHEEMRARLVETNQEIYGWAAAQLLQFIPADKLPLPPGEFVRVIHALTDGLLALRFLTPELISDEIIVAAFEALA